eukprot:1861790-Alexandrium_andersonii.AAC.1
MSPVGCGQERAQEQGVLYRVREDQLLIAAPPQTAHAQRASHQVRDTLGPREQVDASRPLAKT